MSLSCSPMALFEHRDNTTDKSLSSLPKPQFKQKKKGRRKPHTKRKHYFN